MSANPGGAKLELVPGSFCPPGKALYSGWEAELVPGYIVGVFGSH